MVNDCRTCQHVSAGYGCRKILDPVDGEAVRQRIGADEYSAPTEDCPGWEPRISAANWQDTYFISRRAWGAYLYGFAIGANLKGVDLSGTDLRSTNLRWADLRYADLRQTNFTGSVLDGADLRGAGLCGADLRGLDFAEFDLRNADLSRTCLRGFDLQHINLDRVNLGGADLREADLSRADFSNADLRGADLRGADLSDVDLSASDFRFARLPKTDVILFSCWSICHIRSDFIRIGCEYHSVAEWGSFSDDRIAEMDEGALDWWRDHRSVVLSIAHALAENNKSA
jgi:uncharacterized protein YjbI with pentapeptide repeats